MAEEVIYGGLLATRGEVYLDCLDLGLPERTADSYAMFAKAVGEDRPVITLKSFRESESHAGSTT